MGLPSNRQLGGSQWDYYTNTAGGQVLMQLFELLGLGGSTTPPVQIPVDAKTDLLATPPVPATPVTPAPAATGIPGNQKIPVPQARPMNPLLGVLMGPSAPPSQEGVTYSPSQGPGAAVTQVDSVAKNPLVSILEALSAPSGARAGAASAPRAPAPPGPSRMAPGQLLRTIGGQNPMAASRGVNLPLLSRLLGGR